MNYFEKNYILMKVSFKLKMSKKGLISKYLMIQIGCGGKNWLRNYKLTFSWIKKNSWCTCHHGTDLPALTGSPTHKKTTST